MEMRVMLDKSAKDTRGRARRVEPLIIFGHVRSLAPKEHVIHLEAHAVKLHTVDTQLLWYSQRHQVSIMRRRSIRTRMGNRRRGWGIMVSTNLPEYCWGHTQIVKTVVTDHIELVCKTSLFLQLEVRRARTRFQDRSWL